MVDGEGPEHHAGRNASTEHFGEADSVAERPTALYPDTILHRGFKVQYGIGSWL